ncbi:MAG TPA: FtsL-like putative cell division protein [Prolixibacteraceae bacterium]|nr:FtsL-like putative cell division protein [Prolixibacteraceae bacterium]
MEQKEKISTRKVGLRQIVLGSVLINENVNRWLPVVALLTVIGLIMISNRFRGEKILREMVLVQEQVKERKSESVTLEAELMNRSRYSEVLNETRRKGLNLVQSDVPPVKLKRKK